MKNYTLKIPIKDGETEIKELKFRRAKVIDSKKAAAHSSEEVEQAIFMVHRLAGISIEAVEELDLIDFNEVQARFQKSFESASH